MRALRSLLFKELKAHGGAYAALFVIVGVFLELSIVGMSRNESQTTLLSVIPAYLLSFVALAGAILGKRLIVDEYQLHTNEFLQALPLRRTQLVLVKYLLGLSALVLLAALVLIAGILAAVRSEPVGWNFAGLLALRTGGYLLFWWGICFCYSFTGRFRPALIWGSLLSLIGVSATTDSDFVDLWPFHLVDPALMPYQRDVFPHKEFWVSIALGLALTGIGFWLGTAREGRLVSQLSGRLSQREKSAIGVVMVLFLLTTSIVDLKKKKEPYQFESEAVLKVPEASLEILYHEREYERAAKQFSEWLAPRLISLQKELGVPKLPPARIVLASELDGLTRQLVPVKETDGVLIRCNFTARDFDRVEAGALTVHTILNRLCNGRATYDPNHWLLDGFSEWWVETNDISERLLESAFVVRDGFPDSRTLARWGAFGDRHGERLSNSFSLSGVVCLEKVAGRKAVVDLVRAHFVRTAHTDIRESFYQWTHSPQRIFKTQTQLEFEDFLKRWEASLAPYSEKQERLFGAPQGSFSVEGDKVSATLRVASNSAPIKTWTFLHTKLAPGQSGIDEFKLKQEVRTWTPGASSDELTLSKEYSHGDLVWLGLEVDYEGTTYPLRIVAERLEVKP